MHNYNDSLKLVMHSSRAAKCIYMPYYTSHKVSSTEQKPQNLDLIFVMQIFTLEGKLVSFKRSEQDESLVNYCCLKCINIIHEKTSRYIPNFKEMRIDK